MSTLFSKHVVVRSWASVRANHAAAQCWRFRARSFAEALAVRPRGLRFEPLEDRRLLAVDFGDAPGPYPTTLSGDGPRHEDLGPTLGVTRDAEINGQPSTAADGDGTDEDGVTFETIRVGQLDARLTVRVGNAPTGAALDAWIDFNGDGSWGGPGEQIFDTVAVANGDNELTYDIPIWATEGNRYARFRLSSEGDLGVGGLALDGEVEDYRVTVDPPAASTAAFVGPHVISTAADGANGVFAADVDGDGDMDVLSASSDDDSIRWFENDGSAGFTAHTISTEADGAKDVFAVDVDGDGDVDVLSASSDDDKIAWYENDGNEGFDAHTITITAREARAVFAADVDGDGDIDVLSTSHGDDRVAWYENDGTESFTPHTIGIRASDGNAVFAADVDSDGDMDVLSASAHGDTIAWYENDGNQNFAVRVIFNDSGGASSVQALDFDGDGDMDVISGAYGNPRYWTAWYENDGDEFFTVHRVSTIPRAVWSVFGVDLNGDRQVEMLAASWRDNAIHWLANDGDQGFAVHTVTTSALEARSVFPADMDGDGDLDLLSASRGDDKIAWYENLEFVDMGDAPAPYPTLRSDEGAIHRAVGPTLGSQRDDEMDGQPDPAAEGEGADDDGLRPSSMIRAGELDASVIVNVQNAPLGARLDAWIDFNADGVWGAPGEQILDSGLVHNGDNTIEFDVPGWSKAGTTYARFRVSSVGDLGVVGPATDGEVEDYQITIDPSPPVLGMFGAPNIITDNAAGARSIHAVDVDGDGDIDVVSASYDDDKIAWYENDGGGFTTHVISTSVDGASAVYAVDVDGDGDMDVLAAAFEGYQITWYENDGDEQFTAHTIDDDIRQPLTVFPADMDGDGDVDVVSGGSKEVYWYENDGLGAFAERDVDDVNGPTGVYAADVNGDGHMDVVSSAYRTGRISWHENFGRQSFLERVINDGDNERAQAVFPTDLDGDGDMDVVAASLFDDKLTWHENTDGGNFVTHLVSTASDGPKDVFLADMDGDGDVDVLSASFYDGKITYHENDGDQGFTAHDINVHAGGASSVFAADLNGDGVLDVLSASDNGEIAWYESDNPFVPYPLPLLPLTSTGNFVYDTATRRLIGRIDSSDSLEIDLDGEQTVTIIIDADEQLEAGVQFRGVGGDLLRTANATKPGETIVMRNVPVVEAGTYTLTVTGLNGTTGTLEGRVLLNTDLESEAYGGAANDDPASAQDLVSSMTPLGVGSGQRAAVIGSNDGDDDWYRIALSDGEILTVALYSLVGGESSLELYDASGVRLAFGNGPTAELDVLYDSTADGLPEDYVIRIFGSADEYGLFAAHNAQLAGGDATAALDASLGGTLLGRLGAIAGTDSRDFTFVAAAGDVVDMVTTTPGDGPLEFINGLDPRIELYDSGGALIASNDDGAADGRNAALSFSPGASDQYTVRLLTESGTEGEFVLAITGASGPPESLNVEWHDLPLVTVNDPPAQVTLEFSSSVRLDTVQASDLTVGGVPATGVSILNDALLRFELPVLADGIHDVSIVGGALASLSGTQSLPFLHQIEIDRRGPRVVQSSIHQSDVLPSGPFAYTARFDRILGSQSLDISDVLMIGGTSGPHSPSSLAYDEATSILTISFASLPDDSYTLTLRSGDGRFEDTLGNHLDGEIHPVSTVPSGDGDTGGDFIVGFVIDGGAPRVIGSSLLEGDVVEVGPLTYSATFDEPIDASIVSIDDAVLVGSQAGVVGATSISYDGQTRTLTAEFPALVADQYALTLVSGDQGLVDLAGNERQPATTVPTGDGSAGGHFVVGFTVFNPPPQIVESSIHEGNLLDAGPLIYTARFSEDIDTAGVTASNVVLVGNTTGNQAADAITYDAPSKTLTASFPNLPPDDYTLSLRSGPTGLADLAGEWLDGERDSTTSVPSGDGTPGGDFEVHFSILIEIGGTISRDTVLAVGAGTWLVTRDLIVPAGVTLSLDPGVDVRFNAGVEVIVQGRMVAVGEPDSRIQLGGMNGSTWEGIHFRHSREDNLVAFVDIEHAESLDGSIGARSSIVTIDNVTFSESRRRYVNTSNASVIVRNSIFPDRFGPFDVVGSDDDNVVEMIVGAGIMDGGHMIIQGNTFGTSKGHNDIIDFSGPERPGPILQVLDNVFLGASDEMLDLGGDAYIEGNVFRHARRDAYNRSSGHTNAISTGDGLAGTIVAVRNVFYDIEHVINLKNDSFAVFEHNTIVGIPDDGIDPGNGEVQEYSAINLVIVGRNAPGRGAHLDGNILYDVPNRVFGKPDTWQDGSPGPLSDLLVDNTMLPVERCNDVIGHRLGTIVDLGANILCGDPQFVDPNGDFRLQPGSAAIGAGTHGLDLGALVAAGATLSGWSPVTFRDYANFTVDGPGIVEYRYRLDAAPWSSTFQVGQPIELVALPDGLRQLNVIGRNYAGVWQAEADAAVRSWTVDSTRPRVIARDDTFSVDEDAPLIVVKDDGVLANDDGAGTELSAELVSGPLHGTLTLHSDGSFVYVPGDNYAGDDGFTYRSHSDVVEDDLATVSITVQSVNDAPTARDATYVTSAGQTLRANWGVIAVDGPTAYWRFDDQADATQALDSSGNEHHGALHGVVEMQVPGATTNGSNRAIALDRSLDHISLPSTVLDGTGDVTVEFWFNTSDPDAHAIISGSGPGNQGFEDDNEFLIYFYHESRVSMSTGFDVDGSIWMNWPLPSIADGQWHHYIFVRNDSEDYLELFLDGHSLGRRSELLSPVTIAPGGLIVGEEQDELGGGFHSLQSLNGMLDELAIYPRAFTEADVERHFTGGDEGLLSNVTDAEGDTIVVEIVDDVTSGSLDVDQDGFFRYTPLDRFVGIDRFTYRADDRLDLSNIATVTVEVGPQQEAITARDDSYTIQVGSTLIVTGNPLPGVLDNDRDPAGGQLESNLVDPPDGGQLILQPGGGLVYVPHVGFTGTDTFTYRASNGTWLSNLATVTLRVEPSLVIDLNDDGAVDFIDLTILLANWGEPVDGSRGNIVDPATTPVNFDDLTALLAGWTGPDPMPGGGPSRDASEAIGPTNAAFTRGESSDARSRGTAMRLQRRQLSRALHGAAVDGVIVQMYEDVRYSQTIRGRRMGCPADSGRDRLLT